MTESFDPTTPGEVQEIVREAVATGRPLEAVGGSTQLHVGYPARTPLRTVRMAGFDGIIDYVPEDLVVVAEAGMTLAALQKTLAENGQTLPLEVAFPDRQTLGGIVATRAHSLTRASAGATRDWLIGCHAVGGEGQVIVGGGKVVKNVAGYDLPKLYCGSWGTLGIITQVAFKLAPRDPGSQVLLVSLNSERNSEEALDRLHESLTPSFSYLLNSDAAKAILGEDAPPAQFLALAFDGQPEAVEALTGQAKDALSPYAFQILELPDAVGAALRAKLRDLPLLPAPCTVRCNVLPSQVGAFARMLEWTAGRNGFTAVVFADAGAGIVWAQFSPRDEEEAKEGDLSWRRPNFYPELRDKCDRVGGSTVIERMPPAWLEAGHPIWWPLLAEAEWSRKLKQELDPHGIFRPGRFLDRADPAPRSA